MATAVTLLGSVTFSTASGTKTVTATPAVGDLIVIITAHTGNTSGAAPTDNQGGTYSASGSCWKNASADMMQFWIRTSKITSAVSTVFTHAPGASSGGGLAVLKVTGMGTGTSRQTAKQDNQASGGTPTCTFGGAALTTNALIGAVFNASNTATLTPRSSPAWTERADVGYNTPASGLEIMTIDSGETGTAIAWGGTSGSAYCALVLELDANSTLTPSLFTNTNTLFSPTLTTVYTLAAPLFTNTQSFFAPTVSLVQSILPGLFTNTQSFFAPTVTPGPVTLTPSLFTNTQTFFSPTRTSSNTIAPNLFTVSQTFFSPTATASNTLTPNLFTNQASFGTVTVTASNILTPNLFTNSQAFPSSTVSTSNQLIAPLLTNTQTFYGVVVAGGSSNLFPSLLTNSQIFYSPTVIDIPRRILTEFGLGRPSSRKSIFRIRR